MIFILVSTLMFHEQPIPDHSYIKAKLTDFYKIGNLHISGKTKTGTDVENEIMEFNYYKNEENLPENTDFLPILYLNFVLFIKKVIL